MAIHQAHTYLDGRSLVLEHDIRPSGIVYRNLNVDGLYQAAVQSGQAKAMANGALLQTTAPFFGRAAKSSFYVDDKEARFHGKSLDDLMAWGDPEAGQFDNLPISRKVFSRLHKRVLNHLSGSTNLFINDGFSGRTASTRLSVRLITDRAPGALFAKNIFLRPKDQELSDFNADWTILHAPAVEAEDRDGCNGSAFIITDLSGRLTIIGGTRYHGQIKKCIFAVQNFRLPLKGILTMHAGASEGKMGLSAIHAGLSGTGKTTLSNTGHPVADDQIVVDINATDADAVISNMEGGQYAKTENLRRDKEPETFGAIHYGTTAENISIDDEGHPDYADTNITANGRVGYPLDFVPTAKASGTTQAPKNITFLTADGFGVLPPVARLSTAGGMFHFACGFTSKMPGTERGVSEPVPTFSSFFGKPFMPLKPVYYMELLANLIETHGTEVWLVNTGWLGPNAQGRNRVDILVSKAIINAVRDGEVDLSDDNFWYDPVFKLHVPKVVPGVDSEVLDPRNAWVDRKNYSETANKLAGIFSRHIRTLPGIPESVLSASPAPIPQG